MVGVDNYGLVDCVFFFLFVRIRRQPKSTQSRSSAASDVYKGQAPDGAKPLSYPLLVQPVLDRACVRCHGGEKTEGGIVLTGAPEGRYTASYNALAPRVSFSAWGGKDGDFRVVNCEPLSAPGFFGAAGSSLMKLLDGAHGGVALEGEDLERLVTWMDANALFYGTFDPEEQRRQQRGERIAGPQIE